MGQQRPRDAPDLLPSPAPRRPQRRPADRGRPAPDLVGGMGRPVARARRRERHRAGQRRRARDHRVGPRASRVHRTRHRGLRGVSGQGRVVHARVRGTRNGRPRRRHPRAGPCPGDRAAGDDLLDPRNHRAPQRGRQRPRPHRPGAADRPRRALRLRSQPAPRPEQRPGRRRHGRAARPAARLPARRERRFARAVRRRVGRAGPAEAWLAPVGHVRCHGARAS